MNGPLSRGPVTEEGKRRAARSNLSHGMYSRREVLPDESPEALDAIIKRHVDDYRPRTSEELADVHEMARLRWRIYRIERLREQMFGPGATPGLPPILATPESLSPAERQRGILDCHDIAMRGTFLRLVAKLDAAHDRQDRLARRKNRISRVVPL